MGRSWVGVGCSWVVSLTLATPQARRRYQCQRVRGKPHIPTRIRRRTTAWSQRPPVSARAALPLPAATENHRSSSPSYFAFRPNMRMIAVTMTRRCRVLPGTLPWSGIFSGHPDSSSSMREVAGRSPLTNGWRMRKQKRYEPATSLESDSIRGADHVRVSVGSICERATDTSHASDLHDRDRDQRGGRPPIPWCPRRSTPWSCPRAMALKAQVRPIRPPPSGGKLPATASPQGSSPCRKETR